MSTYIHFTEEEKYRANEIDLVSFLERQGEKLLRSGREKRLASDRSITVRGNRWYDHQTGEGGLAIDFIQNYYGLSFPDAVTMLLGDEQGEVYKAADKKEEERKAFILPKRHSDMRRVFAYLIKQRHIDKDIISFFASKKLLYESCELSKDKKLEYHNAVFVGTDENGTPCHGHKCGLTTIGKSFKGNVESSNPCYSFNYIGNSNRLYVFEAPIDMLSFITMKKGDWQDHSYVALCGLSEQAMLTLVKVYPNIEHIILCLDHDEAGIEATERFHDILKAKDVQCGGIAPKYKDWNEDIKASLNLPATPAQEHPQYILRNEICLDIERWMNQVKDTSNAVVKLNNLYNKCKRNVNEQMVEYLKQLSAFSLFLAAEEYINIDNSFSMEILQQRLKYRFKAYENRSGLDNRFELIEKDIGKLKLIEKEDHLKKAEILEQIAQNGLKAAILVAAEEQKKEQSYTAEMSMA